MGEAVKTRRQIGKKIDEKTARTLRRDSSTDFLMPYTLKRPRADFEFLQDIHKTGLSLWRNEERAIALMAIREHKTYEARVMCVLGKVEGALRARFRYGTLVRLSQLVGCGAPMATELREVILNRLQDTRIGSRRWDHILDDAETLPHPYSTEVLDVASGVSDKALKAKFAGDGAHGDLCDVIARAWKTERERIRYNYKRRKVINIETTNPNDERGYEFANAR